VYDDHRVLKKNYFAYDASGKPLTEQSFINEIFITHWQRYFQMITRISDSWFVFMQCPVNNPPPDLGKRFLGAHLIPDSNSSFTKYQDR
jgi:hypothetical protein